jgi:pimeloyl-ACP methyl ester carboxylesterase
LIESLEIDINGHKAHYLKAGIGPPVVLVHGGASDSRDWLGTMSALAPRYSLYAPDLLGFGQSHRNEAGYYLSDFSEFVLGFMDRLGLEKPFLVGHSFGGRLCLEVALRHPERVRRLILADTAGLGRVSVFGNIVLTGFWALRKLFRLRQPYPRFLSREGEEAHWLCASDLPYLRTPTLIVWKRHDPYLPLALARRAKALIPDARLEVLPGYGHAPHKQNQEAFNELLRGFLESDRCPSS